MGLAALVGPAILGVGLCVGGWGGRGGGGGDGQLCANSPPTKGGGRVGVGWGGGTGGLKKAS